MNINNQTNLEIHAHHCEIDGNLRDHVHDKLQGIERLWPKTDDAHVRFTQERGLYITEVTLISGGMITRGEERADNPRQAFDGAMDKLDRQLRRYKKKLQTQSRRHDNRDDVTGTVLNPSGVAPSEVDSDIAGAMAAAASPATTVTATATTAAPVAVGEDDENGGRMVRVKRFALKPMTPDEAALQMDLLGHTFFVFRDAQSNEVSVVYRRRDGDFGLIEPVAD